MALDRIVGKRVCSLKDSLRGIRSPSGMKSLVTFVIGLALCGCQKDVQESVLVYENDFEAGILWSIEGGDLFIYEGNQMLGNYNNGGFVLTLDDLPDHNYISVTFDLYLHDSWDGNNNEPDGPDLWTVQVGDAVFQTTFSNTPCGSLYCLKQSYPERFPTWNLPKTGATLVNLPIVCSNERLWSNTSMYRINRLFRHNDMHAKISFYDDLVQSNTDDPKCDESWSLDNLTVEAINLK